MTGQRKQIEDAIPTLTEHVLASREVPGDLIRYNCDPEFWKDKTTIGYMISADLAIKDVIRHLYCWQGSPVPPEIDTVRAFVDERKREALDVSLADCSSWHLYSVERYLFSLAAMELALDGVLNPELLEKFWDALEMQHKKENRPIEWNALFDPEAPANYVICGLIGKILLGDGDTVIAFMDECSEERKVDIEVNDFDGQPYKVAYYTALRQMKHGDQKSAYHGQRTHASFHTWVWLTQWQKDVPPCSFTQMFMLWAAMRKVEGLPLDPQAILQSFQPEPVCRLFLDSLPK